MSIKDEGIPPALHIAPSDILAGLAAAERGMLATFLALFDDGKLSNRLKDLITRYVDSTTGHADKIIKKLFSSEATAGISVATELAKGIESRRDYWHDSTHSDEMLRLILWICLREALQLPARLSATTRGSRHLADDVAAALIHALDPPNTLKSSKRWLHKQGWLDQDTPAITLADVVVPVLDELLANSLGGENAPSEQERRSQLTQALAGFRQYGADNYAELLNKTGANRSNDHAILITAMLGGGLGAFGTTVSLAGFSAYIAAAKASAFIPMVSGPGLVSFVSVLSNPLTILGIVGGGGWWLASSAQEKANLASRVIALLSLNGLQAGGDHIQEITKSFAMASQLDASMGIKAKATDTYKQEWALLEPLWQAKSSVPDANVTAQMNTPIAELTPQGVEKHNAAALWAMSLGDTLYAYAAVNPMVIDAADFSRIIDIHGRVDFGQLAQGILDGSANSIIGATAHLKGYTAEMAVADQLVKSGHTVSFPAAANEPGWDLLVDGEQFQVKFHDTLLGLQRHFERYDYPVIANTELAESIPAEWADKVFFIDGLSNELITQVTEDSLMAGANMLAAPPLHFAATISLVNGLLGYYRGQLTAKQTVEQVLLDGTVRVGLFGAGGVVGASVGFMVFGPAGAWVFGTAAPVLAQTQTSKVTGLLKKHAKGTAYREWEDTMHRHLDTLQQTVLRALENKRRQMAAKLHPKPENELEHYINWRLGDDDTFIQETALRLADIQRSETHPPEQRLAALLKAMASCGVHPYIYQPPLRELELCLAARPGMGAVVEEAGERVHGLIGRMTALRWGKK